MLTKFVFWGKIIEDFVRLEGAGVRWCILYEPTVEIHKEEKVVFHCSIDSFSVAGSLV